jgi:predicted PurR-regulated permease PerM
MSELLASLPRLTTRQVVWGTLVVVGVALLFWLLLRFYSVILILFIAIVVSTAIRPLVQWLYNRGVPRPAGIIAVYLGLLLLLAGFVWLVAPIIIEQIATLGQALPAGYTRLRETMLHTPNLLVLRLAFEMPPELTLSSTEPATSDEAFSAVAQLWQGISVAFTAVFGILATLILAFYWTLDGERSQRAILMLLPNDKREGAREMMDTIEDKVGKYVAGQALLSLIIGGVSLVTYLVIGLPYALVLAVTAGILEAVPVVGPVLAAIPAILVAIPLGPGKLVAVLVANVLIQQLENSLLVPRIMKQAVGVSPLVTLLSLIAFSSLFGVVGALVAIPLAAVIQLLLERFLLGPTAVQQGEPDGRDYLSMLRYEAQELVGDVRKKVRTKEDVADAEVDQVEDSLEAIATDLDSLLALSTKNGEGTTT